MGAKRSINWWAEQKQLAKQVYDEKYKSLTLASDITSWAFFWAGWKCRIIEENKRGTAGE